MEKYSAFRDPATGIQPFLTPVPPQQQDGAAKILANVLAPVGYLLGTVKALAILIIASLYAFLVNGLCLLLVPVPPLYRGFTHLLISLLGRAVLLLVGLYWIPHEVVTKKRPRASTRQEKESWAPRAGDIIVSNWVSWIEVVWLAIKFNPVFVLPYAEAPESHLSSPDAPVTHTPGRRTAASSVNASLPRRELSARAPISGFYEASLLSMIKATGSVPSTPQGRSVKSLEDIRCHADRPIVVFPECTTSNGRGLLRFAEIFKGYSVPTKSFSVFVMCIRYDPPTSTSPTLSQSIPTSFNPLPHIFTLARSLTPHKISIKLLAPSESPSSPLFMLSDLIPPSSGQINDELSEACAALVAQIGKMKRTGQAWEDKVAFLEMYNRQRRK